MGPTERLVLEVSVVLQSSSRRSPGPKIPLDERFEDEARFLKTWLEKPLLTGAVTPSGKMLARTMASYVDPRLPGPVIELGPGTGPVTDALVRRGIAQDRLVLVEYNPDFCRLLRRRFPKARVVQADAYDIAGLAPVLAEPAAATVSSLPLFMKPLPRRFALLRAAQAAMRPGAPFIQFTYAVVPPIPESPRRYDLEKSNLIWLNLPPARVWVYRSR